MEHRPTTTNDDYPVNNGEIALVSHKQYREAENEDVELYMRQLLARMRGVSEESIADKIDDEFEEQPMLQVMAKPGHADSDLATSPIAETKDYVPRNEAPEKASGLEAMRELANSSARNAINTSTRQRLLSVLAIKASIALIGLIVGIMLLIINGLSLNLGLLATIAAFLMAANWGYDSFSVLGPIIEAGLESVERSAKEAEAAQAVGANGCRRQKDRRRCDRES